MAHERPKLYRSRTDKMLGGVCGGLGDYFDIDPTLIRLAFVFTMLYAGFGILPYVILWIVIPREPLEGERVLERSRAGYERREALESREPVVQRESVVQREPAEHRGTTENY